VCDAGETQERARALDGPRRRGATAFGFRCCMRRCSVRMRTLACGRAQPNSEASFQMRCSPCLALAGSGSGGGTSSTQHASRVGPCRQAGWTSAGLDRIRSGPGGRWRVKPIRHVPCFAPVRTLAARSASFDGFYPSGDAIRSGRRPSGGSHSALLAPLRPARRCSAHGRVTRYHDLPPRVGFDGVERSGFF
jgi:hypothetical protein